MSLLGHRDLTPREITEYLLGTLSFAVERSIEPEFAAVPASTEPVTLEASAAHAPHPGLPPALQPVYARALRLATLVQILQRRGDFRFATFSAAVAAGDAFQTTPAELARLQTGLPEATHTAHLLLAGLLARLHLDLSRVETCTHLELARVGPAFLADVEKGSLDDRALAKLLAVYANYFKQFEADRGEPTPDLFVELRLTAQLEREALALEKAAFAAVSFERKPHLQNKTVRDLPVLQGFVAAVDPLASSLGVTVRRLDGLKDARAKAEPAMTGSDSESELPRCVRTLASALLRDLGRVLERLRARAAADLAAIAAKPKFRRRVSRSWALLEALATSAPPSDSPPPKLPLLADFQAALCLAALADTLSAVLAPSPAAAKDPKIPKGTRDTNPLQMAIKTRAIEQIRQVYLRHGAVEIDTPIFELKETLLGKYGEEGGKLIYDLEDQGGELLSLRYDLTVPFARFMGLNGLQKLKRFHIGKVYRRDQPNLNRGRFREFYQCDFDVAGRTDPMLAEAEVLLIAHEVLAGFGLAFVLKVSHRLLLEALVEVAGCPPSKFKAICSSIDKLDKEPWAAVERELQDEKGLAPEQTAALGRVVLHRGTIPEVLRLAEDRRLFGTNPKAAAALAELRLLDRYLALFSLADAVQLDLSLARGLDYYTGVIYEGVLTDEATGAGLGSIAGGGRYDELIGMFSKDRIPAVGISIGIERLFGILEKKFEGSSRASETEVLVATIGKATLDKKLELAARLWRAGLPAEILHEAAPKPDKQLRHALDKKVPFVLWVGEDEVAKRVFKVKVLYRKEELEVPEDALVDRLRALSAQYRADLAQGLVVFKE